MEKNENYLLFNGLRIYLSSFIYSDIVDFYPSITEGLPMLLNTLIPSGVLSLNL
jgi:hypothetical protein